MGQTPLFGATAPEFDFLAFARVIFASQQGSLVELGIGPIVTAGLLMQLLRGSDILKFDFKRPEERGIFQTATKMLTYFVIVIESAVYGWAVYGPNISEPSVLGILVGQLMAASIIVMFMDELIQKGWGLGSGISLFIACGVAQQILWSLFSPLPAGDGGSIGIIPFIIHLRLCTLPSFATPPTESTEGGSMRARASHCNRAADPGSRVAATTPRTRGEKRGITFSYP